MRQALIAPFLLVTSAAFAQQPTVTAVMNNFSYTLPFSPTYGIAQGSIFDIFGTNLAASGSGAQAPLPTTLNGTTVSISVNGTTTQAILYYVSPTQITAILPSATPVGNGSLVVNNNGQTNSPAYSIPVVQTEFGVLSLDGSGKGPAGAFDANSNLLSPVNATNPGNVITLWGTGLGPVTGDETMLQTPQNLSLPIEVDIGGVAATVQYHGRSIYPGVDQINVVVPANVTPGCWVSVAVLNGSHISNFTTIPVAANGQPCSDSTSGLGGDQLVALYSQGTFNFATLAIGVGTTPPSSLFGLTLPGQTYDNAQATFTRYTAESPFDTQMIAPRIIDGTSGTTTFTAVSPGSCIVNPQGRISGSTPPTPPNALNAGASITVSGAGSTNTSLNPAQSGYYGSPDDVGRSLPSGFIPASGGPFAFVGSGGSDVGAFAAQAVVPGSFAWNELKSLNFVNRSSGVTVTWTGGVPGSLVQITGMSSASYGSVNLITYFTCSTLADAGKFTVPPAVTLSLPPSAVLDGIVSASFLAVTNYTNPQSFTAPGIDFGLVFGYNTATTTDISSFQFQ